MTKRPPFLQGSGKCDPAPFREASPFPTPFAAWPAFGQLEDDFTIASHNNFTRSGACREAG